MGHKRALFDGLFDGTTDTVRFDAPATFFGEVERLVDSVELPELPADGADLVGLDDELELGDTEPETIEPPRPSAPEMAAATEPLPARADIPALFARVEVTRTADGGLRIDAPPGVADDLLALLEGLGALARSQRS